ncbi:protein HEG homolog 1-like [Macrobrachium nipponense]|uniref:protein HEG homolog 1-like n=1 Tax=Macrobrachium nipponense TaxID=159736 RepID=UPI0030C84F87
MNVTAIPVGQTPSAKIHFEVTSVSATLGTKQSTELVLITMNVIRVLVVPTASAPIALEVLAAIAVQDTISVGDLVWVSPEPYQVCDCSAKDIDECLSNPCPDVSVCTNTPGSYLCQCPPGYNLTSGACVG